MLNDQNFTFGKDIPGNEILPDGAVTFNEASDTKLNFKLQVNDVRVWEYHR